MKSQSQVDNSAHFTDDMDLPPQYEDFPEANEEDSNESTEKKQSFPYTTTQARAFLNGVKLLPNTKDTYVFKLAVMAGKTKDGKALRLYGDFFAAKRLKKFAALLASADFDDAGIVLNVTILNFHAEPEHGDQGRIFENYRGFLAGFSIE